MAEKPADEITRLLGAWRGGDTAALAELMPLTYRRLKEIAGHLLRGERAGHTLQTTALVNEAYMRLADLERIPWRDRLHFYAMSARIMRRVLVDHARAYSRDKRRAGQRLTFTEFAFGSQPRPADLVALDAALRDLARIDAERSRIVELRFFGGLARDDIAELLGISSATVTRRWRSARAWLIRYLREDQP